MESITCLGVIANYAGWVVEEYTKNRGFGAQGVGWFELCRKTRVLTFDSLEEREGEGERGRENTNNIPWVLPPLSNSWIIIVYSP